LILLSLCAVLLFSLAFVPATEKDYIIINAPLNNTLSAIQQIANWKKWHPSLRDTTDSVEIHEKFIQQGRDSIQVLTITAFGILVKESDSSNHILYSLIVRPSDDPYLSKVEIRFSTTILRLLYDESKNLATSELNPILNSLRKYLENTEAYYGFPIQFRPVTDTLVITTMSEASAVVVPDTLHNMFSRLYDFTAENSLRITDSPIAYIQRTENTRRKLMAGLPVTKEATVKPGLEYQRMPQGRMLTIDFNGDYRSIQKAYTAADRYITDHNLKTVALPYERYYTKPVDSEDSSRMKIRIYIPVL